MKGDRAASLGSTDTVFHSFEEKRVKRKRKRIYSRDTDQFEKNEELFDERTFNDIDEFTHPTPQTSSRPHRRAVKKGTHVFIPHDILSRPNVISVCVRYQISPNAISSLIRTIVVEYGGDPSAISTSYSSAYR